MCRRITRVLTPQSVGTIGSLVDPPTDTWSNGINPPAPVFTSSEIKHETTNMMSFLESQPSRYPLQRLPGGTQGMASGSGGAVPEFNTSAYYNSMPDLFDVKNQSSSATPDQKYDFHSEEFKQWFSDPGAGDEKTARLSMRSPPAEAKDVGYERLDKRKRAMTPDEAHKMRRTLPEGSQSSESSISKSHTFVPERVWKAGRYRHNPYANARVYSIEQLLGGPHDEGARGERHPTAIPLNPHSDSMPSQPSGARSSGKKQPDPDTRLVSPSASGRGRTPKRKPCDFPSSMKQVSFLT